MSDASAPPGGLSAKEFASTVADVGDWIWGTAQGAFNEKQTIAQIVTDAAIGMIPLVGDVTAARDLIAVSSTLATNPEKREHKGEWLLLVILIFALIPVVGGVIKGVGRISLRMTADAAKNGSECAKIANDMIAFLNRIGHMNAEAWLKQLNILSHESEIIAKFRGFCDMVILTISRFLVRFGNVLPQSLVTRLEQISHGFQWMKTACEKRIPQALKDLHERLELARRYIHSGGMPVAGQLNVAAARLAQTGKKTITYVEEARLIESGAAKRIVKAGKYEQNLASTSEQATLAIAAVYRHEPGFPDLLKHRDKGGYYPAIAAASGPIKNEQLSGVVLFRSFGEKGVTHGVDVGLSPPIGQYWAIGKPSATAVDWRESYAVLDEWNRNGWHSMVTVPAHLKIPACTSIVSEQFGRMIPNQFLTGGKRQAVIDAFFDREITDAAQKLIEAGGGKVTLSSGISIEIRDSGWKNVNGAIGYVDAAIPGASVTERLGITETQTKTAAQFATAKAKLGRAEDERSVP